MLKENRLGTTKVGKLLLELAVPSIIAQIVSLLYNVVDRIYVGHILEIGSKALTGIGVCLPITLIISAFAALVGMGGAPKAAIKMGEKDEKGAEKIMGNSTTMLILLSIVLTIFFLVFGEKLLLMFGASEATLPYALDYLQVYTLGTIFVLLTIGLNPFISTQGFAKTSMITVLIGAIINIVLDPIFIFVFQMGVRGAAWATIISQAISAVWVIKFLTGKSTILKIHKKNLKLETKICLPILALGLSPFAMQATESIINIAFNASLLRYGGDIAVGAMTILASAMQFMFLPLTGLTQGAQPIISYNYGAGNKERVKKAFKYLFTAALFFSVSFWLFLMLAPKVFVTLFTKDDLELIHTATWGLRVYMCSSLLMGAQIACQQTFIALGNAKASLFLALLRKIFLLLPLIYILPSFMSNKVLAVFMAEPVADTIAVTTTVILFFYQFRKTLKQFKTVPEATT